MKYFRLSSFSWLILLSILIGKPPVILAQSSNQAGLVVEFGDGSLYTGCIAFEGESLSGYDLLARSGLSLETAFDPSQGVAVCKIGSDGCPSDDCFCQMPEYWSYWNRVDGSWSYAGSGSSTNRVGDGDVDGWSWGAGSPPPAVSFNELCAPPPPPPPTETPPPTPGFTETPDPQPSDTPEPEPTETSIPPTYTAQPSHMVVPSSTRSPNASRTATLRPSATGQPEATQNATEQAPAPTHTEFSESVVNLSTIASTPVETARTNLVPEAVEAVKGGNRDLVGYAVFGALLVGLGLTLVRIMLKGQRL